MERPSEPRKPLLTHAEVFPILEARLKELQAKTGGKVSVAITGTETPDQKVFANNLARRLEGIPVTWGKHSTKSSNTLVVRLDTYNPDTQPRDLLRGASTVEEMEALMDSYERKHRTPKDVECDADIVIGYRTFSEITVEKC